MFIKPLELSPFFTSGKEMFADVKESSWQKYYPHAGDDACKWALRSLYIRQENICLLIDTGFSNIDGGILQTYKLDSYRNVRDFLIPSDFYPITHVLFTHLHVDHCGGILHKKDELISNRFEKAVFIAGKQQLNVALKPSEFEADSFQYEIIQEIANHQRLKLVEEDCFLFPWLELHQFHGHTEGLLVPIIHKKEFSLAFVGDLIPSVAHLILGAGMTYDINLMLALAERQEFLEEAYENEYILFFQHDFYNECCTLKKIQGKIAVDRVFRAEEIF